MRGALALALACAACGRGALDAITARGDGGGAMDGAGDTNDVREAGVVCPSPLLGPGDTTKKLMVGSVSREYILHIPSGYTGTAPVPLVVDFHPIGGSDMQWRSQSPYPAVIDKEGVISAFPNGEPSPNLGNAWDVEGCCNTADDVAFSRALVADVESVVCVDTKRVYAVGFSMGGGMANYLGCQAADLFAGIAPSSFDLLQENVGDCRPARPITVVSFRGMTDTLVPYGGGASTLVQGMPITFLGAQATFQKWAQLDGCTGNPSAPDGNGCATYSSCTGGVQVTLCSNQGGQQQGDPSIAWPILQQHPLR